MTEGYRIVTMFLIVVIAFSLLVTLSGGISENRQFGQSNGLSNASSFKLVNVTLTAKDWDGIAVRNAQVKAFSEDWGFRVPNFQYNQTDANGNITLTLTVGNWSFFAWWGLDSISQNIGQGYFVASRYVVVNSNSFLTLQPNSSILTSFSGLDDQPLQGDLRVVDSDHAPIIQSPTAGRTDQNGKITLRVTGGVSYDILFSSQNSTTGYCLLQQKAKSGSNLIVQASSTALAHLIFNVFDKNYGAGQAWFFVNYDYFNIGENTGLAPVNIAVYGKLDLYSTPTLTTITPWITNGSWCYSFDPYDYNLKAGVTATFNLGGPLSLKLWTQESQTQTWLDLRDSFGNLLSWFWNDGITTEIPITLTKDAHTVFNGNITSSFSSLGVTYSTTSSPTYQINLDMGPYGTYSLTGTLLSNDTLLPTTTIHTEHLNVIVPNVGGQVTDRFNTMAALLEQTYQIESASLEEDLTTRSTVRFQIDVIAGVAGSNFVGMAIGFCLGSSYLAIPSTFIGVESHELGHVFQLSPPVSPPGYYITSWYGEPYATLIGNLAIEQIFGDSLAFFDRGAHDNFLLYLQTKALNDKLIENIQFVLYYIESEYGLHVFKGFNQMWTKETTAVNLLLNRGFSTDEAIVTALSFSSGDNLSWIFNLAGLNISENHVAQGMAILARARPVDNFLNLTEVLAGSEPRAWVAETVIGANQSYLTVGGDGMSFLAGGELAHLPNNVIRESGFLSGAAWNGNDFLLVGQRYSPRGGVTMYLYSPATNSLTNLTGLFTPSLSSANGTLLQVCWNGSVFYVLGLENINENPSPVILYSYNPTSNILSDLTSLLPSNFQPAGFMTPPHEMLWTPDGLYLFLAGAAGNLFGVLRQNTFTELSSLLPSGFAVPNGNGEVATSSEYLLAWSGSQLFLAGQKDGGTIALLAYRPSSNQLDDYSYLYANFTGAPVSLTYNDGNLYLSGFAGSALPLLTALNTSSLQVTNLTSSIPASFGPIASLAISGKNVFMAGGSFGDVQYGLLTPAGDVYSVSFNTYPTAGSISFDSSTYINGQSGEHEAGIYTAVANIPTGYTGYDFTYNWSSTNNVTITDPHSNPTTIVLIGNGTLNLNVGILGDLNGDNKVSLADLVVLANAYGSKPDDSNWNSNADIDGNGIVGLSDLVQLAQHYGQHYP
jgi:hypothetical protein